MDEATTLDTHMLGHAGITGAFLLPREATLVETGPLASLDHILDGLAAAGVDELDHVLVTHIHLDHAGAAGALAQRFPRAMVWVHPVGAPHLVDPSKLWSSAARIYGDAMEAMWGGIEPLSPDRIRTVEDGDVVRVGQRALRAVETLGHARHHHAYLDESTGAVFAGDALGVRLPDLGILRPATPPPEFDLEAALASIERIKELAPRSLWLTHFGPVAAGVRPASVEAACDEADAALREWSQWTEEARAFSSDLDDATAFVRSRARAASESTLADAELERLEATSSYRMNTWGFMRYLDKRKGGGGKPS
jgi:glyoxylase-like metal-dependent hydrolase (beta-lactamase superfamily II)